MSRGIGVGSLVIAGGAFAIGLVLGGLGPRAELRQTKDELFELRRKGMDRGRVRNELVDLVANGFARQPAPTPPQIERTMPSQDEPPSWTEDEPVREDGVNVEWDFGEDVEPPEDPVEAAREVMELRRTQARAALMEDIDPSPTQEAEMDRILDDMNGRLQGLAEDIVAEFQAGPDASQRRVFMEFAAEGLDIVMEAEDGLLGTMTPEQLEQVREETTDPTAFVDPALVDVLAELEGLVEP